MGLDGARLWITDVDLEDLPAAEVCSKALQPLTFGF